ncbi:hypothetical protein GCM10010123_16370 [Pilimelia anulata]|uniref:HAD family hydrolase n=1 Tax=Pilimelia anulata TaxID=53371 RepID=A0A8J3F8J3_9ACTN|nr:hypothetical protein [Pilimelia anulata]GGJ87490.1 hypothetical protein GCM10010123_16370 [Pilimelia anulata]
MARDRVLLLDAYGVLFADPMRPLFEVVGADAARSATAVAAIFEYEFRQPLYSGDLPEPEFWPLLASRCGIEPAAARWRRVLRRAAAPLPALFWLPALADEVDVWLLVNHRHEWFEPALRDCGADRYVARTLVSSRTGLVQPQPAAYRRVRRLAGERAAVFVGGAPAHVAGARAAGLPARLADARATWATEARLDGR